jgi:hypothetical protein
VFFFPMLGFFLTHIQFFLFSLFFCIADLFTWKFIAPFSLLSFLFSWLLYPIVFSSCFELTEVFFSLISHSCNWIIDKNKNLNVINQWKN